MKHNQTGRLDKLRSAGLLLGIVIITLVPTACGPIKKENSSSQQTLWRFLNQSVRIEPSEEIANSTSPNDHPVSLPASQIRTMLAAVQAQLPGKSSFITGKKIVAVFSDDDLEDLSEILSQGLAKAGPNEDIVMVKAGYHRTGAITLPEKLGNTARIFYRDGHLNLIFGELLVPYTNQKDPRLSSVKQGSRTTPAKLAASIISTSQVELAKGRSDWVILNQQAVASSGNSDGQTAVPVVTAAPVADDTKQQALQLRVEKLENQLQVERQQKESETDTPTSSIQNTEVPENESLEVTAETRLVLLKHLLERGLIPEEVYRERVGKILDEEL